MESYANGDKIMKNQLNSLYGQLEGMMAYHWMNYLNIDANWISMTRDVTAQRDGNGHVFSRILQSTVTWSVEFLQHGLEIAYDEPRKY
jgi:hypothetical protein